MKYMATIDGTEIDPIVSVTFTEDKFTIFNGHAYYSYPIELWADVQFNEIIEV